MAIDFPASPTNGQTFVVGSVTYTYDGTKWTAVAAGGGGGGSGDKIAEGDTSAEVIDTGSDGRFVVTTEGSEALRVDPSGRLLVGTPTSRTGGLFQIETSASDASRIHTLTNNADNTISAVWKFIKTRGTSNGASDLVQNGDDLGTITFAGTDGTNTVDGAYIGAQVDAAVTASGNEMPTRLTFSTTADGASTPTERMRITNSGVLKQSTTGTYISATARYNEFSNLNATSGDINTYFVLGANTSDTSSCFIQCFQAGVGGKMVVFGNGDIKNANNVYGSLSDIKLKENIVNASSQWDDLKALQVRNYNFKKGQTHTQIGLVAQEVESVSPGLVSESPDHDAEGNDLGTVTKSVNYSVLYMKAVKALQEAMERIETLEAKVTALEGTPSHNN